MRFRDHALVAQIRARQLLVAQVARELRVRNIPPAEELLVNERASGAAGRLHLAGNTWRLLGEDGKED